MEINYNNRKFKVISSSVNGNIPQGNVFHYRQVGSVLTCSYHFDKVLTGQLLGRVNPDGMINMVYQQINGKDQIRTGSCVSTPELMENGKLRLHEKWQWTNGDLSKGSSILEEV